MQIIMPWQKTCPDCSNFLRPRIYADPNMDPRKSGNLWECNKCNKFFVNHDISYKEHIELIKKYYMKDNEDKIHTNIEVEK